MTKLQTVDPIRPNAGVEAAYRARLRAVVEEMHQSWLYWVTSSWRKAGFAMDAGPSKTIQDAMNELAKRWQARFDEIAPDIAQRFAKASAAHYDRAMMAALKRAGFSVKFKPTRASLNAYRAVSQENVNLIKSIGSEYLTDVQTQVWRAVSSGYDMETLRNNLQRTYGLTDKRASLIARDQSAKANAAIESARRQELGITEAIWMHSSGGKEPRPSHVAASGKRFKLADGMMLDGEQVWPGTAINCRCVSKSIIPGL